MLAVIHHINSPKLKQYPSDVIGMAKNKIKQKEADMLTVVDDNLKNDERLQVVDALYSMYTGDIFLQKYNECLCEGINKAFDRQYKTITDADRGLFMKDTNLALTYAFKNVKDNSKPETALNAYNNLISNLRNAFSHLFPESSFSNSNKDFFSELSAVFKKDAEDKGLKKTSLTQLLKNLDTLGEQYKEMVKQDSLRKESEKRGGPKEGHIPEKWVSKTYKALYKVIGAALWERVTMQAREQALRTFDVEEELAKLFTSYGWTVESVNIGKATQTGANSGKGGKSIVADSMVEITIIGDNGNGKVIAKVKTGDSTKFSQSLATRGIKDESTGTRITGISELVLRNVLKEINPALEEYWERRMSPFLTANDTKLDSTVDNWNDTLQAIKIMAAFDAMAVRIGGGVQTLSFNTKIMSIRAIAQLGSATNPSGANYISLSGLSSITNTAKGGKYSSYISDQYENQPNGDNPDKPERHQDRYNTFIKGIMDTKFKASVNVLAASRTL